MEVANLTDFELLRPLFLDLSFNLVIDSVLVGNTRGLVLEDHIDHPKTAILWNRLDMLLVVGDSFNERLILELNLLLNQVIMPELRKRGIPSLTVQVSPSSWKTQISSLFAGIPVIQDYRRYYQNSDPMIGQRNERYGTYQIQPLDKQFLAQDDLENFHEVMGWLDSFWTSKEAYLRKGIGYCLVIDNAVASWCLSVYAFRREIELGVATILKYRNRGFASLVSANCVLHCQREDLIPHWHTFENNSASIKIAEKVGFSNPRLYPVYRLLTAMPEH